MSSKVMSHHSTNLLWLCRVGGHGRDHGRGIVMWTCHVDDAHTRIVPAQSGAQRRNYLVSTAFETIAKKKLRDKKARCPHAISIFS